MRLKCCDAAGKYSSSSFCPERISLAIYYNCVIVSKSAKRLKLTLN